ncbi:MAG: MlaD family protein [Syntrophales bacterium LBB04]|nr:MlaD family protein [Syntrophales bacterium LBB04]
MAKKTSNFMIGLFVTSGVLIGAVLIVWLSASKYFQKGRLYVAYFNESVQGLQADSSVKYRGVDVGNVEKIRVAPDNKLIEILMKINLRAENAQELVAQLKSAGITGLVFIELDQKDPKSPDLSPKIDFPTEYPVIASRPSDIAMLLSSVDHIISQVKAINIKGIAEQLSEVIRSVDNILTGERMKSITANLDAITGKLNTIAGDIQKLTAENGSVTEILGEVKGFVADGRTFVNTARDEVQSVGNLIDGLNSNSRSLATDLKGVSDNLRRASDSLNVLLEQLGNSPSQVIFSKPVSTGRNE